MMIIILFFLMSTVIIVSLKMMKKKNFIEISSNDNDDDDDTYTDKILHSCNRVINTPYIIGIAGASGSGKSYIAKLIALAIKKRFPNSYCNEITILSQDNYYKGGNNDTNYDIPESIDFSLLKQHLQELINGKEIDCPVYNFNKHKRTKNYIKIIPTKIIIVEGILLFTQESIRKLLNIKIYIDASIPTQIFRRALRDTTERGRTLDEVQKRFENHVWPSYQQHVHPSSSYADITINNFNNCYIGPGIVISHIISVLQNICI